MTPKPTSFLVFTLYILFSFQLNKVSIQAVCCWSLCEKTVCAGGPGVCDPCEMEPTDAVSHLGPQQAEALTHGAQVSLHGATTFNTCFLVKGLASLSEQERNYLKNY